MLPSSFGFSMPMLNSSHYLPNLLLLLSATSVTSSWMACLSSLLSEKEKGRWECENLARNEEREECRGQKLLLKSTYLQPTFGVSLSQQWVLNHKMGNTRLKYKLMYVSAAPSELPLDSPWIMIIWVPSFHQDLAIMSASVTPLFIIYNFVIPFPPTSFLYHSRHKC